MVQGDGICGTSPRSSIAHIYIMRPSPPRPPRNLALAYELNSRSVEFPAGDGDVMQAYLTEETPREGKARASRSILLIADGDGWQAERTRRLADRLAVFCFALVLVPDLLRDSSPFEGGAAADLATWASGSLPPARIAADLRAASIYLRADHRASSLALVGSGAIGGSLALRALSAEGAPLGAVAGIALSPARPRHDELLGLRAPLLLLLNRARVADDEIAADATAQLKAHGNELSDAGDHMVMQATGLDDYLGRVSDHIVESGSESSDGSVDSDAFATGDAVVGEVLEPSLDVGIGAEDAIIMAESWINLHCDRQERQLAQQR